MVDENAQPTKRDAIIFLPGLGGIVDQNPENIARRLADAFDRKARKGQATFTVGRSREYSDQRSAVKKEQVYTIYRQDNAQERPILDLHSFGYIDVLTQEYRERNLLWKLFHVFLSIILNTPRIFLSLSPHRQQLRTREKLQFLFSLFILTLAGIYLIILIVAIITTILQVPQVAQLVGSTSTDRSAVQQFLTLPSQVIVILFAVVELFYPQLKQRYSEAAVEYISSIQYINSGLRKQTIAGQFAELLEDIVESDLYRNIHIIGFSFGTIVALDNFFPVKGEPGPRHQDINTLVTIGCPYDLISLYWPKYFEQRHALPNVPQRWLNVYAPIDIMGSSFRDDNKAEEPNRPIQVVKDSQLEPLPDKNIIYGAESPASFWSSLVLIGLRAHAAYWEAKYEHEQSVFSLIVPELYREDIALS